MYKFVQNRFVVAVAIQNLDVYLLSRSFSKESATSRRSTLELSGGEAVRLDEYLGVLRRPWQRIPTSQFDRCFNTANTNPKDEQK